MWNYRVAPSERPHYETGTKRETRTAIVVSDVGGI